MAHYLVTGGAGFIGSHIVEALIGQNERVTVIDNFSTGDDRNISSFQGKFRLLRGDIRDGNCLQEAFQSVDYVIHQAALPSVPRSIDDPISSNSTNIDGTLLLLTASRTAKVKRFIFASSSSVYGLNPQNPKQEDQQTIPKSPYALTKLTGEHYCRLFYELYNLETVALRYFNVFGPRQNPFSQYAAVIPLFITALLAKKTPPIYSDGEQTRDFTFISNVVDANLKACLSPKAAGKVFNIGAGRQTSVNELFSKLSQIINISVNPMYRPERVGDVRHSVADISRAIHQLDYCPQIDIDEGLIRTVEYYSTHLE